MSKQLQTLGQNIDQRLIHVWTHLSKPINLKFIIQTLNNKIKKSIKQYVFDLNSDFFKIIIKLVLKKHLLIISIILKLP
jgi:hypothetical protein